MRRKTLTAINSTIISTHLLTRIFSKIQVSTISFYRDIPCWEWQAQRDKQGYGVVSYQSRPYRAHRMFYELFVGAIPLKFHCDHLCRVPYCVNPSHLEPVTAQENRRCGLKGILLTHCPQGHEYSIANTAITSSGRQCRICCNNRTKQRYRKQRPTQVIWDKKSTCFNGHPWTPENVYIRPDGFRSCRRCRRDNKTKWRQINKLQ